MDRTWPLLFAGICLAVFAFCRAVTPALPAPAQEDARPWGYRACDASLTEGERDRLHDEWMKLWYPKQWEDAQLSKFKREQGFIQLPACMVPESGPGSDGWWRGGGSP